MLRLKSIQGLNMLISLGLSLFVFGLQDLATSIGTALQAHSVVQYRLTRFWVHVISFGLQLQVSSSFIPAGLGNFSLRMRHYLKLLFVNYCFLFIYSDP